MLIVNLAAIEEFTRKYPQSRKPMQRWVQVVDRALWKSLNDVKKDFNSVDYVHGIYIFNIKEGNTYRLTADIVFIAKTVSYRSYDPFRIQPKEILDNGIIWRLQRCKQLSEK